MSRVFRRFGSYASSFLLLAAMLATLHLSGCGNMSTGSQPPPPTWLPSPNDFRFQGVGADMSTVGQENGAFGGGGGYSITAAWGSPIELGNGACVPGYTIENCEWFFHDYLYTAGQSRDTTAGYDSGALTDLNNFPNLTRGTDDLSAPNLVIRSLDVQPANDAFAVAFISSPSVAGFQPSLQHMQVSDLPAFAASQGLKGRVVTALSLDSPTTCDVFSYGWANDPNSIYETSVEPVTRDTVASVAQNMAAEGYVITAFGAGGQPNFGWYMVGTRLEGSTTPRPIFVSSPDRPSDALYYSQGYVDVVTIFDSPTVATSTRIWVVEK